MPPSETRQQTRDSGPEWGRLAWCSTLDPRVPRLRTRNCRVSDLEPRISSLGSRVSSLEPRVSATSPFPVTGSALHLVNDRHVGQVSVFAVEVEAVSDHELGTDVESLIGHLEWGALDTVLDEKRCKLQ